MITTYAAEWLAHVKSQTASVWYTEGAMQGMWVPDGTLRVGHIRFPTALRDTDWGAQAISQIRFTLKFDRAGYADDKIIGLYDSPFDIAEGHAGVDVVGSLIGQFGSNGRAYTNTTEVVFSADSNAEVFAGLLRWLQQQSGRALSLYYDEAPGSANYTRNYLRISAMELEITSEPAGSKASLDADSVYPGDTVMLTIDPLSASGTVTHTVEWAFGEATSGVKNLGSSLTASFEVPMEWLYQMPDRVSAEAKCLVTTLVNGTAQATRTLSFRVNAPDSVAPTFDIYAEPSGTTGGFYQYLGGAEVGAQNVTTFYGAEIVSYAIAGSENVSGADMSVTTPVFQQSGAHSYTVTLTDTRGMSVTKTITIGVNALAEPRIDAFAVRRYSSFVDDSGETVYRDSLSGGKVRVTIDAAIDTAGGNNVPAAYIVYESAAARADEIRIPIAWPDGADRLLLADDRTVITADVPLNSAYEFTLVVEDRHSSATAASRVEKSWTTMHFAGSGYGVAVGGYSSGTELQPEFRSFWPIYGADGFRIDGVSSQVIEEFGSGFEAYSAERAPKVSRVGRLVQLSGACKPTASISGSATAYTMFTLPREFWPENPVIAVCQGSTYYEWMLQVDTQGNVMFSRYRAGSSYSSVSTGTMLAFHAMWVAADIPVQDDDSETGDLIFMTYPAAAMTSNSSQDCVASASSINSDSSTFAVWKAFDYETDAGWCHKPSDESPWIQLQMPKALKNIKVTVYAYDANLSAKGNPTSGTLMGSTNGSTWTQIGAFSGWDGSASGKLGEIVCDNAEAYSYVRLNITGYTSGKYYAAIGYMAVQGGYEV